MAWRGSGIWQRTGRGTECAPLLLKHMHKLKEASHAQITVTHVYSPLDHKCKSKVDLTVSTIHTTNSHLWNRNAGKMGLHEPSTTESVASV